MNANITPEHVELLRSAAIDERVAVDAGVRSALTVGDIPESLRWCKSVPGLVFPWRSTTGRVIEQYRPDEPIVLTGDPMPAKYLFPKGEKPVINVHPVMRDRVMNQTQTIVVVEGTKQHLSAVTAAADTDLAVVGLSGCYGWLSDGQPIDDLAEIPWAREIVVIFDGDIARNRNVNDAARRLGDELELRGAKKVRFAVLPGDGTEGLDDVLAARRVAGSTATPFLAIVKKAGKVPSRPPRRASPYFDPEGGLLVAKLANDLRDHHDLAVDPGDRLLVYDAGVYVDGRHTVTATIGDLLGERFRPLHHRAVVELLVAQLVADDLLIVESPRTPIVNVANGLLDPFTGDLSEHTPEHLSLVQIPVMWNPSATSPTFDAWVDDVTGGRGDDLLEATAQVLDQRGDRQRKAVFLYGPTRSGKSTFLRIIEAVVGPDARSAVTLHDLAGNRFAAADLFGKVLNAANELSAKHVEDLAIFKAVTGDDPVRAERKYGQPFTFRNRALFMFAANEIPTVSEVSGAYLARIRPYHFPNTYEGREDPAIETAILRDELEGVLVRLVEALRRFEDRGGYAGDDTSTAALEDFARHSDRVRLFLHEATDKKPNVFTERTDLFDTFERWALQNRRQVLGRHRFYKHVATAGYRSVSRHGTRGFVGLDIRAESHWGPPDDPEPDPGVQKVQNTHTPASREENEEGEEASRVREGYTEPAPSAPNLAGDDREVQLW